MKGREESREPLGEDAGSKATGEGLRRIEWLLSKPAASESSTPKKHYAQPYGNLIPLNTIRKVADSVEEEVLTDIVDDYLDLLDTSAAVYETNGDYALGIFSSGWCRFMDQASRRLCGTDDNREALQSGKWHCHESCWRTSKASIDTGEPADFECLGGIRIHAVPIRAGGEIVGSINFGYGDPPRDPVTLQELAARYGVEVDELRKRAEAYESRPPFMVEVAKSRLRTSARMLGTIIELRQAESEIRKLNAQLDQRVRERTAQLKASLEEMQAFSYSISHDLRAPLRAISGFTKILLEEQAASLSEEARHYLDAVRTNVLQMGHMVDDLLAFARLSQQPLKKQAVAPAGLVRRALADLRDRQEGRRVEISVGELPVCHADPALLKQVWVNLLDNALKYTSGRDHALIEVGSLSGGAQEGATVYFVKDNGMGFDMQYAHKLFGVFQRLHRPEEYEGTGVGLAIIQRIIHRHGGRVWAEAQPDQGATFYFTLTGGDSA